MTKAKDFSNRQSSPLAAARGIAAVDPASVVAGSTFREISAAVIRESKDIILGTARESVTSPVVGPRPKEVVAPTAFDTIIARRPVDDVGSLSAVDPVGTLVRDAATAAAEEIADHIGVMAPEDPVPADPAAQTGIVSTAAEQDIISAIPKEPIGRPASEQLIRAEPAEEEITAGSCAEDVRSTCSRDGVVPSECRHDVSRCGALKVVIAGRADDRGGDASASHRI